MQNVIPSPISLESFEQLFDRLFQKNLNSALASTMPGGSNFIDKQQLSIPELAEYLNCSPSSIHNYKRRGVFPFYQTGRTIYFKKSEVDAALASNKKGLKQYA